MNDENQPVQVVIDGIPAWDYGKTRSAIEPEPIVANDSGVWVHKNIAPLTDGSAGFEYDLLRYERRDYDKLMLSMSGDGSGNDDYEFTSAEIKAYNVGSMRGAGLRGVSND